ncbi:S8 family serine peptidase [Halomicroarcula sp. GCM10025324]|uniref:S8 family serine peptidase n=1 Tax=Haloarcula TaxID=2237 RepID=UPI0023E86266|nr:S8 family serine peptidase [Halomicroarcula sp. ZS-22-S1]
MPDRAHVATALAAVGIALLTVGIGLFAVMTTPTSAPDGTAAADADPTVATSDGEFRRLHRAGITGSNVSVGVVDVAGFDLDSRALSGHVRETRAFGRGGVRGDANSHGTATATVLARTAPDAALYLARVGGVDSYRRAVEWLTRRDVDVIVAPVSFYGQPGDGTGPVARTVERATDDGTLVVAPAGNLADSHWQGTYDRTAVDDGVLQFDAESRRNRLRGGTRVTMWLSWERAHAGEDYTLELYRENGSSPRLVARSQAYRADDVPNERIVADVSPGEYFVVVRGPQDPTGARLRVVSPTHELQHSTPSGSLVAPATAHGVLAVGAYNSRVDRVEPFSSRGPTADGRTGIDVVAPDRRFAAVSDRGFVGSSAAVPYVGGTAALVLAADDSLSPRHVELLLELTSEDVAATGVDYATGHGEVDPVAAVRAADNRTAADGSETG